MLLFEHDEVEHIEQVVPIETIEKLQDFEIFLRCDDEVVEQFEKVDPIDEIDEVDQVAIKIDDYEWNEDSRELVQ